MVVGLDCKCWTDETELMSSTDSEGMVLYTADPFILFCSTWTEITVNGGLWVPILFHKPIRAHLVISCLADGRTLYFQTMVWNLLMH